MPQISLDARHTPRRTAYWAAAGLLAVYLGSPGQPALAEELSTPAGPRAEYDVAQAKDPSAPLQKTYVDVLVERARELVNAEGDARDPETAALMLEQAVKVGSPSAMVELARLLAAGDGTPADPDRARALLEDAIANGAAGRGADVLGDLYRADTPLRDAAKAVDAYQVAADADNNGAMIKLARMLMEGAEVPADLKRAKSLLERAIASGNSAAAADLLGDLLRSDSPLRDPVTAAELYAVAGTAGNPWATLKLARMLSAADGVPADPDRAESLLKQSIAAGTGAIGEDALGDLYAADTPFRDLDGAAAAYGRAADAGNEWSMVKLARLLMADDASLDFERVRLLLERAMEAGLQASAGELLGDLYIAATPERDAPAAARAYALAGDAGNSGAMVKLGRLLFEEEAVPADPGRAVALLERAIEAGAKSSGGNALGDLYQADTPLRDSAKAVAAYERASAADNASSMVKLARLLTAGDGAAADPGRALQLLERAVAVGAVATGKEALGDFYRADTPLRDFAKAEDAYAASGEAGNGRALVKLAQMLMAGDEISKDPDRARVLLEQAISLGSVAPAADLLGDLYRSDVAFRDLAKAAAAYDEAGKAGNGAAMVKLAQMVLAGEGTPLDQERAIGLLKRAIASGSASEGAFRLGQVYLSSPDTGAQADARRSFEMAATEDNGWAHLALTGLDAEAISEPDARKSMVAHLQAASRLIPREDVALAMLRLPQPALVAAVQDLLKASIPDVPTSGVYDDATEAAVVAFCSQNQIASCNPAFFSLDMLVGLLQETHTARVDAVR